MSRTALFVCSSAVLLLALTLVLSPLLPGVEARSNGQLIASGCDLSPIAGWPNGRFGRNKTGAGNAGITIGLNSGIMPWTDAPVASTYYTIRSGDVGARTADPTKYIPGDTLNEIHIRVQDLKRRFIGLVLYATNVTNPALGANKETRVGSWVIPAGAAFQIPSDTCGTSVVTHTDANLKPLHTRFFFKAPAGTGTIKFRVLIKQGEQNKGSFFYPVQTLTLTEGAPIVPPSIPAGVNATILPLVGDGVSVSVIGNVGRACADVCALQTPVTPYCHKQAIQAIKNVSTLQSSVSGQVACRLPMLAGCEFAGVPTVQSSGYCSFRADNITATCPAAFNALNMSDPATYEPDVCYTAPLPEAQAICICTNNVANKGANPFAGQAANGGSGSGLNSAATSSVGSNGAFVALFAAFAALVSTSGSSKSTRSLFIVVACVALVVAALASPVAAHNYIKSQHRANVAAVSNPCQQRIGNQPHVQVIGGQFFEVEWSVGHGDYTHGPFFFVTIPASAYLNLKADNITAIIADYIKLAPLSAYKNVSSNANMWEKHHIRLTTEGNATNTATGVLEYALYENYFKEPLGMPSTDESFIVRELAYTQKASPSQYKGTAYTTGKIIQTRFKDELSARDKRVSYASDKYPWIESVDAFDNSFASHYVYSNQADLARFQIPARHGAGDYIVWFYWAGYKDCIDVNVMAGTTPVALRYGYNVTNAATSVIKQDHCEYTYIPYAQTQARKLNNVTRDASQCIADCRKLGYANCPGVQVVRATNPPGTMAATPNIPYVPYYNNVTKVALGITQPCILYSVSDRVAGGCDAPSTSYLKKTAPVLADDDYVCFGVLPLRNQDNQVEEDYTIASDPLDPVFYSTCFMFVPVGGFLDVPELPYVAPDWAAGDQCVDCSFHASLTSLNVTQAPSWVNTTKSSTQCMDCSIVSSTLSVAQLQPTMSGADQPNAGI